MENSKPQLRDENGRFYKPEEIKLTKTFVAYSLGICLLIAVLGVTI